jgi:cell division cycle protein 20 (cofactor of APC complex)
MLYTVCNVCPLTFSDLNLLDWSSTNLLAVCLGSRLYLWNASSGEIQQLLEMAVESDYVSSVSWLPDGSHLAIGTSTSEVQVWSSQQCLT